MSSHSLGLGPGPDIFQLLDSKPITKTHQASVSSLVSIITCRIVRIQWNSALDLVHDKTFLIVSYCGNYYNYHLVSASDRPGALHRWGLLILIKILLKSKLFFLAFTWKKSSKRWWVTQECYVASNCRSCGQNLGLPDFSTPSMFLAV